MPASPPTRRPPALPAAVGVVGLVAVVLVLVVLRVVHPVAAGGGTSTAHGSSGLSVVHVADLPPEARRTIALIASDGPFPYRQDGVTFTNREGILPREADGYYREYTVVTPGSSDRGARRVIAGRGGEEYYTDDHYASFREIVP